MTLRRALRIAGQLWRSLVRKDDMDAELNSELAFHFEQLVAENRSVGMSTSEARREARLSLGHESEIEEDCRDQRHVGWAHDLYQDLVFALRLMRRNPAFTATAVFTLAIGIGAHTAIVGVADALLFSELAFRDPERLVIVRSYPQSNPDRVENSSTADYFSWSEPSTAFQSIGASLADQADMRATQDAAPERLTGQATSVSLFSTLGVRPLLGRLFSAEEGRPDQAPRVVLISYGLWQRRFGGDRAVLGRTIYFGRRALQVVGVMPENLHYLVDGVEYWVPLWMPRDAAIRGGARYHIVAARLRDGVTAKQAQDAMDATAPAGRRAYLQPLRDALHGWARVPIATLEAAVWLMLLIACANIAGLLMGRGSMRNPELALRTAVGATRGRLLRQLISESLLLSVAGSALGLVIPWFLLRYVHWMTPPPGATRVAAVPFSLRTVAVALVTSVLVGILFGCVPAVASVRLAALKEAAARPIGRMRGVLVAGQIALALALLSCSCLLLKSFVQLATREFHLDTRNVITFEYRIPVQKFLRPMGDHFEFTSIPSQTLDRIYRRLQQLPGGVSVAGISYSPVNSLIVPRFATSAARDGGTQTVGYFQVTPGFFHFAGAHLINGRDIGEGDIGSSLPVAVVNETMARRFWPGVDAIGKEFYPSGMDDMPRRVVGVIRDIPLRAIDTVSQPVAYMPFLQPPARFSGPNAMMFGRMIFLLRPPADPNAFVPSVRKAAAEIDPETALAEVYPLAGIITAREPERALVVLFTGIFAAIATFLAAIGVYGIVQNTVSDRKREIAVRVACGARPIDIVLLLARWAVPRVAGGMIVGLAASVVLAWMLRSQLWQTSPTDPAALVTGAFVLVVAAVVACITPFRRAALVPPAMALRE